MSEQITVLPVKITVVPCKDKKGYSLQHNQAPGWKGVIGPDNTWGWYKYKRDAEKRRDELHKCYNQSTLF